MALKKVYLEITNICNAGCAFCPGTKREKGYLSPEKFRTLAEKIRPHCAYLYFHLMGEPLTHPKLRDIMGIAEELDFKVIITTNGMLLGERGGEILRAPLHRVNISLHSFEGNGKSQGLSEYLSACTDFGKAASEKGAIVCYRLWNENGADTVGLSSQNGAVTEHLRSVYGDFAQSRGGFVLAERVFLQSAERFIWPSMDNPDYGERGTCYGLRDQIGVLCDGTVVPCCLDSEGSIPLGNLFEESLEDILSSPLAQSIKGGFEQGLRRHELCRRCGYSRRFG